MCSRENTQMTKIYYTTMKFRNIFMLLEKKIKTVDWQLYILSQLISVWSCTTVTYFKLDPDNFHTGLKVPGKKSDGSGFNIEIFQMSLH